MRPGLELVTRCVVGALVAAAAAQAQSSSAQVQLARRSDGVFVLTNNPDREPEPLSTVARRALPPSGVAPRASRELRARITDHARAHDLDPRLVEALIGVESAFDSRAVSHKGAIGLMQLMPSTAIEMGVEDAFDVEENLRGGTAYLRFLLDRFSGDLTLALAGYNAGPGAVERYRGVPPYRETTEYVRRVLRAYGGAREARAPARPVTVTRAAATAPASRPPAVPAAAEAGR